jgi:uncharacterized membrane protein YbhN (UPF0104 family)
MAAIIFTLMGNITGNLMYILIGVVLGGFAFLGALYMTLRVKKETGIDDVIFINAVVFPLMVAIVFTLGSVNIGLSQYQVIWFDMGLAIAIFIVFMCVWIFLKQKWKFLIVEDVDFTTTTDKEKYPQFLLATLILGGIFGLIFIVFKFFFIWFGYQITSYIVMSFTLLVTIILSFFLSIFVRKMKERPPKVKKEKEPKIKKEKEPKIKNEKTTKSQ